MVTLRGISSFQWSESEQIWPFEKSVDGSLLYCKEVDFGSFPRGGNKSVAHGISGLLPSKVHSITGIAYSNSAPPY